MSRTPLWTAVASLAFLAACSGDTPVQPAATTQQSGPEATAISDGNHGGNAQFFFLPPMVAAASYTGTFDATHTPVVRITEDGAPLIELNATIPAGSEHYQVNWHTQDFDLDPTKTYRITVLVGGVVLGFADVDVVSSAKQLKSVNTGEYIALLDGRTLPIKFRIESDPWVQVSGGSAVVCGLKYSGRLFCWGQNGGSSPGGLGNGTVGGLSTVPVEVSGAQSWSSFSTGYGGSCAVTKDGRGFCWRGNPFGALGIGANPSDVPYSAEPREIAGNHRWSVLAYGEYHVCGLTTSQEAWCWGINNRGQLGDGTLTDRYVPVRVLGDMKFSELKVSQMSACAVRLEDALAVVVQSPRHFCWGQYDAVHSSAVPVEVTEAQGLSGLSLVAPLTLCARDAEQRGYCWGWNSSYGTLGTGPVVAPYLLNPTLLGLDARWLSFSEGIAEHVCGITIAGSAYCWGDNISGELGDGSTTNRDVPVALSSTMSWLHMTTVLGDYGMPGKNSTCGLATTGDVYCWGANYSGQLGAGLTPDALDHATTPVKVLRP